MVYLWIVFGTILGGGVHDFLSGMMSERNDGKSISEVVGLYMGKVITFIMRVFSVVLLVMVGVNFSVGPAGLLAKLTPDMLGTMFWLVVIMVYYLIATFLPIDKIIGKLYPRVRHLPHHHGPGHRRGHRAHPRLRHAGADRRGLHRGAPRQPAKCP